MNIMIAIPESHAVCPHKIKDCSGSFKYPAAPPKIGHSGASVDIGLMNSEESMLIAVQRNMIPAACAIRGAIFVLIHSPAFFSSPALQGSASSSISDDRKNEIIITVFPVVVYPLIISPLVVAPVTTASGKCPSTAAARFSSHTLLLIEVYICMKTVWNDLSLW